MRKAAKKPAASTTRKRAAGDGLEPARVELGAECTLRNAAELQARLVATVSPADTVIVDAGAVSRIDMSCLQLLVAFARREAEAGRRITWHNPSAPLREACARVGLDHILGLAGEGGAP